MLYATYFEASIACYQADGLNLVNQRPSRTGLRVLGTIVFLKYWVKILIKQWMLCAIKLPHRL